MKLEAEYPYTYARVSAMKSKLLKLQDYDKLQKMGMSDIIKFLSENEYKSEIEKFGVRMNGIELIEFSLLENTSSTYNKLKRICDPELIEIINTYLLRNDIHNLKTILRGKVIGKSNSEISALLLTATRHSKSFFDMLVNETSIEKITAKFVFLNKEKLKNALSNFKDSKSLIQLENLLDKYMFEEMFDLANKVKGTINDFLRAEINGANYKLILKMKYNKQDSKDIIPLLIRPKRSTLILVEKTYHDILKELKKTYPEISEDLLKAESTIDKKTITTVSKLLHQRPLTADIIIGYLFAKEIETRNLRLIIKAKEFNLDSDFVESQLVVA